MAVEAPLLHLLCGKIAAGKSTLAAKLALQDQAVLIAEDEWLGALYPGELSTGQDFLRCSGRIRQVAGPHVVQLLRAGVSVVLDFQGNTPDSRRWMRGLVEASGAAHQFHVLAPPDEVCLARLRAQRRRRASVSSDRRPVSAILQALRPAERGRGLHPRPAQQLSEALAPQKRNRRGLVADIIQRRAILGGGVAFELID